MFLGNNTMTPQNITKYDQCYGIIFFLLEFLFSMQQHLDLHAVGLSVRVYISIDCGVGGILYMRNECQ